MGKYDDIINLSHHVSAEHPRMSMSDRAAQFSPFAALTGYDDAIRETGRLTDVKMEIEEEELDLLNRKFRLLLENLDKAPEVSVLYFEQDEHKEGGAYRKVTGVVKKADEFNKIILMRDGTAISMDDVIDFEGDLFSALF